ncbi:MAG: hypothetical protein Q7S92_02850 [Candidatus Diapherotrites archaeon]|nr:hypothetical protein [Candidatus Diapherotrites archaeon]
MPRRPKTPYRIVTPVAVARIGVLRSQGKTLNEIGEYIHRRYGISPATAQGYASKYFAKMQKNSSAWKKRFKQFKTTATLTPEQRSEVAQTRYAGFSKAEKDRRAKKISKTHKRRFEKMPASERGKNLRASWIGKTDAEIERWKERISRTRKEKWKQMSPQERAARMAQSLGKMTRTERIENARKAGTISMRKKSRQERFTQAQKASQAARSQRLQRLGLTHVPNLPILDLVTVRERNKLWETKKELVRSIVQKFRGHTRWERDVKNEYSEELIAIGNIAALTAIRKWDKQSDLNQLIQDQIRFELLQFLSKEKGKRIVETRTRIPEK